MEVTLNGKVLSLAHKRLTLWQLLQEELGVGEQTRGLAVAINDEVIPRSLWPEHTLAPGDRIEVIRATQGG